VTNLVCATVSAVLLGLLVNEFTELCPWMARGLVRWAARLWTSDSQLALCYAEEWVAVIEACPGKLLKLFTALRFALGAVWNWQRRAVADSRYRSQGMTAARYVAVLSSQPALPLLAFGYVRSPVGWALVLALVAEQNALTARTLERFHRPMTTRPGATTRNQSEIYLWEITWVLHALAVGAAAVYSLSALLTSTTPAAGLRAAMTLLLVSVVAMLGSPTLRRRPLGDLAAGAFTLAVIGSAARVAFIAVPSNAVMVTAVVVFGTGLAVRTLPFDARRGPQFAMAVAVGVLTVFLSGYVVKAAVAPILQSLPVWRADLAGFADGVAAQSSLAGWELMMTIGLLGAASALALPPILQRRGVVAGAALLALAAPASLGLGWAPTLWLLMVFAIALLVSGTLLPSTKTVATNHFVAAGTVGIVAIGVALARPWSTAAVLGVVTVLAFLKTRRVKAPDHG